MDEMELENLINGEGCGDEADLIVIPHRTINRRPFSA